MSGAPVEPACWSASAAGARMLPARWPHPVTRKWEWGASTGRGLRVCVLDSGIEPDHTRVGPVDGAVVVTLGDDERIRLTRDEDGDVAGHGTACAGIIRSLWCPPHRIAPT